MAAGLGAVALAGSVAGVVASRPPGPLTVDAMLRQRPFLVAHRGSEDDWPEMSEYAFDQSVTHRVQALELSVSRSSDGVWFGLHDGTLARTSGVAHFVAAEHTWEEIRRYRITAAATRDPHQSSRPYLDLQTFLDRYAATNVLFIDPKAVEPAYYAELIGILDGSVRSVRRSIVAKSPGANTVWADLARDAGIRSWGFYYATDLSPASDVFTTTKDSWDWLGFDQDASDAQWATVMSQGKPVIGHVISTRSGRNRVVRLGAHGVMAADILAAMG